MTTQNADNERIKRRYFAYLKEAKRHSEPTVDAVAKETKPRSKSKGQRCPPDMGTQQCGAGPGFPVRRHRETLRHDPR